MQHRKRPNLVKHSPKYQKVTKSTRIVQNHRNAPGSYEMQQKGPKRDQTDLKVAKNIESNQTELKVTKRSLE